MSDLEPHNIPGLVRSSSRPRVPLAAAIRPHAFPACIVPLLSVTLMPSPVFFDFIPAAARPPILRQAHDERLERNAQRLDSVNAPHAANSPVLTGVTQLGIFTLAPVSSTGQTLALSLEGEGMAEL